MTHPWLGAADAGVLLFRKESLLRLITTSNATNASLQQGKGLPGLALLQDGPWAKSSNCFLTNVPFTSSGNTLSQSRDVGDDSDKTH